MLETDYIVSIFRAIRLYTMALIYNRPLSPAYLDEFLNKPTMPSTVWDNKLDF